MYVLSMSLRIWMLTCMLPDYSKLPSEITTDNVFLLDPLVATGGTSVVSPFYLHLFSTFHFLGRFEYDTRLGCTYPKGQIHGHPCKPEGPRARPI